MCDIVVYYGHAIVILSLLIMPKWPREVRSKTDGCEKGVERSDSRTLATSMVAMSSRHVAKCQMFLEVFHSKVDFCWTKSARLAALQRQKSVTLKTAPLTCNGQYETSSCNIYICLCWLHSRF